MDAEGRTREKEKTELLNRLAELMVEEHSPAGVFDQTPHFSVIEDAAIKLRNQIRSYCQEFFDRRSPSRRRIA